MLDAAAAAAPFCGPVDRLTSRVVNEPAQQIALGAGERAIDAHLVCADTDGHFGKVAPHRRSCAETDHRDRQTSSDVTHG